MRINPARLPPENGGRTNRERRPLRRQEQIPRRPPKVGGLARDDNPHLIVRQRQGGRSPERSGLRVSGPGGAVRQQAADDRESICAKPH